SIRIPGALRESCDGASELALAAPDVRSALEQLERSHPALYRSICDETGRVRRHVNLFVNTSNVRDREGLDTPLVPGDVVTILPAVSGGSPCHSALSPPSAPRRDFSSPRRPRRGVASRSAGPSGPELRCTRP